MLQCSTIISPLRTGEQGDKMGMAAGKGEDDANKVST